MIKEKVLVAKLKSKDKQAFAEMYDLYVDKIYRFVYFKVGDVLEAEDLTSSIFLKTWNHLQQKDVEDFKTVPALIYKIARNTIIDHYRKNSREELVSIDASEVPLAIVDEKQNLAKNLELAGDMQNVNQKLAELKDEYREAIILRYVNELSIAEIAIILAKTRGNVRILIFRAMNALREMMNEEGK